jgi:CBS domain containing-hemolysin-like protein
MELPIFLLFIYLLGISIGFVSGIFIPSSFDDLNEKNQAKKTLEKLFDERDLVTASLGFIEHLLYIIAIVTLTLSFVIFYVFQPTAATISFFLLIFVGYIIRSTIFAVGIRFHKPLINLFATIINSIYSITKILGMFHIYIRNKISATQEDESSLKDIQELVENAHEEGSIQIGEYKILSNVIRFNQVPIEDIMTPRTVIFSASSDMTVGDVIKLPELKMFSRFPIYEGKSLDDKVVGYVVTKDILQAALNNQLDAQLKNFSRQMHFIPENATLDYALNQFLAKRQHIFLVVDEFGGIEGLVTMEDLIETILGVEIIDEADKYIDLRELAKMRRDKRTRSKIYKSESDEEET